MFYKIGNFQIFSMKNEIFENIPGEMRFSIKNYILRKFSINIESFS